TVRPHGFSHNTGSPYLASCSRTSTCSFDGAATRAPSTSGRSSRVARGASMRDAASSDGSTTHAISTAADEARAGGWDVPIRPAAMSAILKLTAEGSRHHDRRELIERRHRLGARDPLRDESACGVSQLDAFPETEPARQCIAEGGGEGVSGSQAVHDVDGDS